MGKVGECYSYSLKKNLQTSINKGFKDKTWLETETSLDFIRKEKRFIEIVEQIE